MILWPFQQRYFAGAEFFRRMTKSVPTLQRNTPATMVNNGHFKLADEEQGKNIAATIDQP